MTEMNDKILDASRALFDENLNMAKTVAASQGSKRIVENAQLRSSEDLHKFLERYEQNQKEQAAENEKNKKTGNSVVLGFNRCNCFWRRFAHRCNHCISLTIVKMSAPIWKANAMS